MSMFEQWELCEATVIDRREYAVAAGGAARIDIVVDVVAPDGSRPRVTISPEPGVSSPSVGEVVTVRFDAEAGSASLEEFLGATPDVLASMHTPPGGISADPGERLAKLQALKEQGLVSEDEYRLQRQRLIDMF
jgi:uncharacterized protein (DUF58 family)